MVYGNVVLRDMACLGMDVSNIRMGLSTYVLTAVKLQKHCQRLDRLSSAEFIPSDPSTASYHNYH